MGSGSRMAQTHGPVEVDTSIERYAADLSGSDKSDRLYAARVLRSRLRVAMRVAERAPMDSLRSDDALVAMDDFDAIVAPACVEALRVPNVAHHCAEILGWLEHSPAEPALQALLSEDAVASRRLQRRAQAALERIQADP